MPEELSEAGRFRAFAKKIVLVPKREIDKRAAEYAKKRAGLRKAKP